MKVNNITINSTLSTAANLAYDVEGEKSSKPITRWVTIPAKAVQFKIYFSEDGGFDAFMLKHQRLFDTGKIMLTHINHRIYKSGKKENK